MFAYKFEEIPLSSDFTIRSFFIEIVTGRFQGVQAERNTVRVPVPQLWGSASEDLRADTDSAASSVQPAFVGFSFKHYIGKFCATK